MRERLAQSLAYILETAAGPLALPPDTLDGFLRRLRAGPVGPSAFGAYGELVLALEAGEPGDARALLEELASAPAHGEGPRVSTLRDPRTDPAAARWQRLVDTDPEARFTLAAPPPEEARACEAAIAEAFNLLDRGHPELAAELRALLREIVLAAAPDDPGSLEFDGASSFLLWGGIVLNVNGHRDVLDMVQVLAHESGHNLLFGLAADEPLVRNDGAARYASPLRRDPRPMDGIVHATYVSARMHEALAGLLASGELGACDAAAARQALDQHAHHFDGGMRTIAAHARLSATGHAVLEGAAAYMRRAN
jgi:HEXXH motif-containing protein